MTVVIPNPYLEKQPIGSMAPGSIYLGVNNEPMIVSSKRLDDRVMVVKLETGVRLTVLGSSSGIPVGRNLYCGKTTTRVAVDTLRAGQTFQVEGSDNVWMLLMEYDRKKDWLEIISLMTGKIAELKNTGEVTLIDTHCELDLTGTTRLNLPMTDLTTSF